MDMMLTKQATLKSKPICWAGISVEINCFDKYCFNVKTHSGTPRDTLAPFPYKFKPWEWTPTITTHFLPPSHSTDHGPRYFFKGCRKEGGKHRRVVQTGRPPGSRDTCTCPTPEAGVAAKLFDQHKLNLLHILLQNQLPSEPELS